MESALTFDLVKSLSHMSHMNSMQTLKNAFKPLSQKTVNHIHNFIHYSARQLHFNQRKEVNYDKDLIKSYAKVLEFNKDFEKYLDEIESITNVTITDEQRKWLKNEINTYEFTRLTPQENKEHRKQLNKVRAQLIQDWETHTNMNWGKYVKDKIYNGKIIRHKGQNFDMHEIILSSWNSPHVWQNMTPCPTPAHQQQIHGKHSMAEKIFGNN